MSDAPLSQRPSDMPFRWTRDRRGIMIPDISDRSSDSEGVVFLWKSKSLRARGETHGVECAADIC